VLKFHEDRVKKNLQTDNDVGVSIQGWLDIGKNWRDSPCAGKKKAIIKMVACEERKVPQAGFEPATYGFEDRHSIH
jgi:hypothetical protein